MPFSFATPEDLGLLEESLERAWAMVVERHGHDPLSAPGARERLAYIVSALWRSGLREGMAEQAFAQFEATTPSLTPTQAARSS
ncbi:hypothetical protein [Bosea sp. BK604]|uniref:hypothetical protein n=1 Tax=Bosea sp. BK604 TaxID=2512180 RepID=UPI0010429125|nr:hypothetical protein [Bosea sp. BK604]TCR67525.1 hypothetical protein EV560_103588 [Bosea sp. BK604]